MATGNILQGLGRRSLGDVVMYRRNGKQVSRVRVRKIRNPRTDAQMVQRITLNTVSQAYSRLKSLCDHSFQNRTQGERNMSRFLKVNIDAVGRRLNAAGEDWNLEENFAPIGQHVLCPNPYVVSEGSYKNIPDAAYKLNTSLDTLVLGNPSTAEGAQPFANTYEGIINQFGLQRGDQITLVVIGGNRADITDGNGFPDFSDCHAFWQRIILDPVNTDGTPAPLTSALVGDNGINLPNPQNNDSGGFSVSYNNGLQFVLSGWEFLAYGIIVTHKYADGSFAYSSTTLQVPEWQSYGNMGEAIRYSMQSGAEVASALYLRQAKN